MPVEPAVEVARAWWRGGREPLAVLAKRYWRNDIDRIDLRSVFLIWRRPQGDDRSDSTGKRAEAQDHLCYAVPPAGVLPAGVLIAYYGARWEWTFDRDGLASYSGFRRAFRGPTGASCASRHTPPLGVDQDGTLSRDREQLKSMAPPHVLDGRDPRCPIEPAGRAAGAKVLPVAGPPLTSLQRPRPSAAAQCPHRRRPRRLSPRRPVGGWSPRRPAGARGRATRLLSSELVRGDGDVLPSAPRSTSQQVRTG